MESRFMPEKKYAAAAISARIEHKIQNLILRRAVTISVLLTTKMFLAETLITFSDAMVDLSLLVSIVFLTYIAETRMWRNHVCPK